MNKTHCYTNPALVIKAIINIEGERRKAIADAIQNVLDNVYGKKVKYCDGVTRYPWERQPYEDIKEKIEKLKESDDTLEVFGGFYCCVKFALEKLAPTEPICAEMLQEIKDAENNAVPDPGEEYN